MKTMVLRDAQQDSAEADGTTSFAVSARPRTSYDDSGDTINEKRMLVRIVESVGFESSFAVLILLNTLTIALEVQYRGFDIGHKLNLSGYPRSAPDEIPGAQTVIDYCDLIVGALFSIEVVMKMCALHIHFFRFAWNVFDLSIMLFWAVGKLNLASSTVNPTTLRVLRLMRVLRVARLFKTLSAVDSLFVLMKSIRASLSALIWTSILLSAMITFTSLMVNSVILSYFEDENIPLEKRQAAFLHFGTFTKAAASFFEATLGNFGPIMKQLSVIDEAWTLFFMTYKVVGGFAVTTVITGVFLHETFAVAASDDDLLLIKQRRQMVSHFKKMSNLFEAADVTHSGILDWATFQQMIADPFVQHFLSAYDLRVSDCQLVFELMDDGDGRLTVDELIAGVGRLKGGAKSLDLHLLLLEVHKMKEIINAMDEQANALNP